MNISSFSTKKIYIFISLISFGLFIFFSFLVHKNLFSHFDFNTTVRFQDHISRRFDNPFSLLSTIGSFEVTGIALLIIVIFIRKWKAVGALVLFAFFHVFEIYGKTFVKHFPPPHFMLRTHDLISYPAFYIREENSYPSGHAARAVFVTTLLFLLTRKTTKLSPLQKLIVYVCLISYDIVMIISRIYLGEHWTTDVIGGSLLGLAFGLFAVILI